MAFAYTPGLQVKSQTVYRVRRTLPISGDVLVQQGEQVDASQVVARTEQPGSITPVNLANALSMAAQDVPSAMQFQAGDVVTEGDIMAISPGIFGFFRQSYRAPVSGTIESVSSVTGQVIVRGDPIPVEVKAFVSGKVVEVIPEEGVVVETAAAFVQGIFGVGGEVCGPLAIAVESLADDLTPESIREEHRGTIVVGGRRIHGATVARARDIGVAGLIAGGIDDQDLKEILGYDLGVAITGSEQIGLTIIITEGFGEIAMAEHTFALLRELQGETASINGATQIRAGVLRPEIVIPRHVANELKDQAARVAAGVLQIGSNVRLIRDPYFGKLGTVVSLPSEPVELESGSRARVLEVDCETGETVTVPRANVEIVAQ